MVAVRGITKNRLIALLTALPTAPDQPISAGRGIMKHPMKDRSENPDKVDVALYALFGLSLMNDLLFATIAIPECRSFRDPLIQRLVDKGCFPRALVRNALGVLNESPNSIEIRQRGQDLVEVLYGASQHLHLGIVIRRG